jgi:hypothetical protein
MPQQGYVATIKVLVRADGLGEAQDYLAETLRNLTHDAAEQGAGLVDWGYLHRDTQITPLDQDGYRSPHPIEIHDDYHEGELI